MNGTEKRAVKVVAKVAPWLAPVPSAYFVARSAIVHLEMPLTIAVVSAAIIETLGLSTVHSALWAVEWNETKRQSDPEAPVGLTLVLGVAYMVATLGLVVALEVAPWLSVYAPAIFPILAVVGAINLAFIAQQEGREAAQAEDRRKRRERRQEGTVSARKKVPVGRNGDLSDWERFLTEHPDMLDMSGKEIGDLAGVSARTGRNWKKYALEAGYGD